MFVIGGAPRSGTSLLSSLVSRIPRVAVAHDSGLYYYLKFAVIKTIANAQSSNTINNGIVINTMCINDIRGNGIFENFLNSSVKELLTKDPESDIYRKILDQFLQAIWQFWVNDGNHPDPSKDRGKGEAFLSLINGSEIINATDIRNIIEQLVGKFALSMNNISSENEEIIVGEKTRKILYVTTSSNPYIKIVSYST